MQKNKDSETFKRHDLAAQVSEEKRRMWEMLQEPPNKIIE
jgi:hypothetical protein